MEMLCIEADKLRTEQTQSDEMSKREHLQRHIRVVFEVPFDVLGNAFDTSNAPLGRAAPSEQSMRQLPGSSNAARTVAAIRPNEGTVSHEQ